MLKKSAYKILSAVICLIFIHSTHAAESQNEGRFLRCYWFEKGIEHGNPLFTSRFRVNAPESVLHPSYGKRSETTGNGMMQILMQEDLFELAGANFYMEIWGGHPGTANKRLTVNGRSTYSLPEVGTQNKNCTHMYPTIPLKITDLVRSYNVFQFACDQGNTFWGHFIVDNACLRAQLKKDHPDLEKAGLDEFEAAVTAIPPSNGKEVMNLHLEVPEMYADSIATVAFQGFYEGYDENGNTLTRDWHGFTKNRQPVAYIGVDRSYPYETEWDLSMIPDQQNMAVRAMIQFKEPENLLYITKATENLQTPSRSARVMLKAVENLPNPFWSRADRKEICSITLDVEPNQIERVIHHVVVWDGGRGTISNYYTLNGHPLPVAGTGRHDVIYTQREIDPMNLTKGENRILLHSDTDHHGIECLLPGPALMIRMKQSSTQSPN